MDPNGRGGARDHHDAGRGAGRSRLGRRRLLLLGGRQADRIRSHGLQLGRLCRLVKHYELKSL